MLLDGFDELEPNKRSVIASELSDMATHYGENYFIVSSRPDEYIHYLSLFKVIHTYPLTLDQSSEIIRKTAYDDVIKQKFLEELRTRFYVEYKDFASNPLLLLIMLMTYDENAAIQPNMSNFYDEAFSTLYKKHDATKSGYRRFLYSNLPYSTFKHVLSAFSMISYFNNSITFNTREIYDYFDKTKKIANSDFNPDDFLKDLLQSVCVLTQDGLFYTFTHKTFQEYFTALFIVNAKSTIKRKIFKSYFDRFEISVLLNLMVEIDKNMIERELIIPKLLELKISTRYGDLDRVKSYYLLRQVMTLKTMVSDVQIFLRYERFVDSLCKIDEKVRNATLIDAKNIHANMDKDKLELNVILAYENLMNCLQYLEEMQKTIDESIENILNL